MAEYYVQAAGLKPQVDVQIVGAGEGPALIAALESRQVDAFLTGTPVPGGLSWNDAIGLLRAIRRARKRIVGLDLCEVAPGETEWDANVGARLLYKMIGFALLTQSA